MGFGRHGEKHDPATLRALQATRTADATQKPPQAPGEASRRLPESLEWSQMPGSAKPTPDWRHGLQERFPGLLLSRAPRGWALVIGLLAERMAAAGWNPKTPTVVFSAHGGLGVFSKEGSFEDAVQMEVVRAMPWSFRTCERCGDGAGHLGARGHRMETTCVNCERDLKKEDPDGKRGAGES